MAQQLQALDREFHQTQQSLFPQLALGSGVTRGNPFQEAIDNEPAPEPTPDPPAEDPPHEVVDPPVDEVPEPTPPDEVPDVGSGGDGTEPEPFDFLITGHFSESPTRIWRARRDSANEFSLEDLGTVNFFPGFIPSLLTFEPGDRIVISDLNADGRDDFVVARLAPGVGTAVESYVREDDGGFELHASTVLYLKRVQAVALFDFNSDGRQELVLSLREQTHLFIYEEEDGDWTYRREIVLPWEAGLLLKSTAGAPPRSTNLYILDESLQRVASINSRAPTTFVHGSRVPLTYQRVIEVEFAPGATSPEVVGFPLPDQVVLVEITDDGVNPFVVFEDADRRMPTTIIGDYSGRGRQVIWIP